MWPFQKSRIIRIWKWDHDHRGYSNNFPFQRCHNKQFFKIKDLIIVFEVYLFHGLLNNWWLERHSWRFSGYWERQVYVLDDLFEVFKLFQVVLLNTCSVFRPLGLIFWTGFQLPINEISAAKSSGWQKGGNMTRSLFGWWCFSNFDPTPTFSSFFACLAVCRRKDIHSCGCWWWQCWFWWWRC